MSPLLLSKAEQLTVIFLLKTKIVSVTGALLLEIHLSSW